MERRSFDSESREQSLKRRWQERNLYSRLMGAASSSFMAAKPNNANLMINNKLGLRFEDDLICNGSGGGVVEPPVTVAVEGRSICHRISLHKHASYQSLAKALRHMFVVAGGSDHDGCVDTHHDHDRDLDLSNAVPGHLIAYEDMENDLLLVGDLNWKDFVRVAKRIRIMPVKAKSRKGRGGV